MSIVSKISTASPQLCSVHLLKSLASVKFDANSFHTSPASLKDANKNRTPKISESEKAANFNSTFGECIKSSRIQICGSLYQSFKDAGHKTYQDVPINGIETEATYFDNVSIVSKGTSSNVSNIPTLVIFPGSPGYSHHFSSLIGHLTNAGVRVVSVNFPTFDLTRAVKYFRHSPPERVEFAKAILKEVGVSKIDVLSSHSSGTFSSLHMWRASERDSEAEKIDIKSLALFNPLGYEITVPMQPYWFTSRFVKYYQRNGPRKFLEKFGVPLLTALGNPFVRNKLDDIVWGGCCLHYNDRKMMENTIKEIVGAKLPTLIKISDNDSVMNKSMNETLIKSFGGTPDAETLYDKEGACIKIGSYTDANLKIVRTKSGGHFSFMKYADAVNQALTDHLERVLLADAQEREGKTLVRDLASDSESTASDSDMDDWVTERKVAKSARFNFAQ